MIQAFQPQKAENEQDNKKVPIVCKHCRSTNNAKYGSRTTQRRGKIQKYYCKDCEITFSRIDTKVFPCSNGAVRVQGYQVIYEGENGVEMHPEMEASFCLYSLQQAKEMIMHDMVDGKRIEWKLLTCYKGDVEEPTLMFKGKDPRV